MRGPEVGDVCSTESCRQWKAGWFMTAGGQGKGDEVAEVGWMGLGK